MSEEQTQEIVIGAGATLRDGGVFVPLAGLPAGTVISISITIGGATPTVQTEPAPQKPKYMSGGRTINGGA